MVHELWGLQLENDQYYMKIAYTHFGRPGQPGLSPLTPLSRIANNYFKSISKNYSVYRRAFCETMILECMITQNTPTLSPAIF